MSNFTIVGEIGEIIVDLLKAEFRRCDEFSPPITEIALGTPELQENAVQTAKPQIIVFLYSIDKCPIYEDPDDLYSRLPLELRYLMIAVAKEKSIEHKMAGKLMEVLNNNRTLAVGDHADKRGFADAGQAAKINVASMPIEEKHKLWTAFPKIVDKTFVPYIVKPVVIVCPPPPAGARVEEVEYIIRDR